jgi:2-C-methyl-D-erythritol 4-phosphate cytidylyltransferase
MANRHAESADMPRYVALIPAAGSGSRFGDGRPKQYMDLLGKPMLAYSVEALARHPRISAISVVVAPNDGWFREYDWCATGASLQFHPVGGATRAHSVSNGLQAFAGVGADDWVLVHDAARPCLSAQLLDRLIDGVGEDAVGGLLAMPVADTRPREGLWGAQTPQMFRRGLLERALAGMHSDEVTDESSAVEKLGLQPLLIESSAENLKVTFPADRVLAETILQARHETGTSTRVAQR